MAFKRDFVPDVFVGFCRGVAISTAVTAAALVGLTLAFAMNLFPLASLIGLFLFAQYIVFVFGPVILLGGDLSTVVPVGVCLFMLIVVSLIVTAASRRRSSTVSAAAVITDLAFIGVPMLFGAYVVS